MTTIPMKEVAAFLLGEDSLDGYWFGERHPVSPFWWREHLRAALSAPATAPEQQKPGECWPERIMKQWDEMRDLTSKGDKSSLPRDWFESLAEMRLIDAPTTAWHVAPTVPGLWLNSVFMKVEDVEQWHIDCQLHLECARWFGPIPPDGDKP